MIVNCPHCGKSICQEKEPWQIYVKRIGDLHLSKIRLLGKSKPGRRKNGWSTNDLAKEVGISKARVIEILRVYQIVQVQPSLERMQNLNEVLMWIKRQKN